MPAPKGTGRPVSATSKPRAKQRTDSTASSPRTQKKRPGDLTGTRKQRLDKEHADEQAKRQVELSLAAAADEAKSLDEVIDYTEGQPGDAEEVQELSENAWAGEDDLTAAAALDSSESETELYDNADIPLPEPKQNTLSAAVDVQKRKVVIRVNSKIEDMVFGREVIDEGDRDATPPREPVLGNLRFYNFEENHRYKVPVALALHLEELGYLYH